MYKNFVLPCFFNQILFWSRFIFIPEIIIAAGIHEYCPFKRRAFIVTFNFHQIHNKIFHELSEVD